MDTTNGMFVWYDAMTTDIDAASAFYGHVLGWEMKDTGRNYILASVGAASTCRSMVAGLMPIPPEARDHGAGPRWTGYIAVADVDAFAKKVKAEGGAVCLPAEDIAGVGRFAVVADPHGAVFIIFKSKEELPPPGLDKIGHIGWHELHAGDLETDFAFYSKLFGWTKADAVDMGSMGKYQLFDVHGKMIGGMMTKAAELPSPCWLYYFNVESVRAAVERVKKGGGTIRHGPNQVPGDAWIVQCEDPQGAMFALTSREE